MLRNCMHKHTTVESKCCRQDSNETDNVYDSLIKSQGPTFRWGHLWSPCFLHIFFNTVGHIPIAFPATLMGRWKYLVKSFILVLHFCSTCLCKLINNTHNLTMVKGDFLVSYSSCGSQSIKLHLRIASCSALAKAALPRFVGFFAGSNFLVLSNTSRSFTILVFYETRSVNL